MLLRKMRIFLLIALALPAVFLMRLLRPLVVIRLEPLNSGRIGHFLGNKEMYLCERDTTRHNSRTFDIFYYNLSICNLQVKKMWERTGRLHISPFSIFTRILDRFNRLLPGGKQHTILTSDMDFYGLRARTKPCLSFTSEEERLGRQGLERLGIADGTPFICFHARDAAYLDSVYPDYNWRYHDFRDTSIYSYIPAAEELVRRGYSMIRMGAVVKEALNTNNPRIIDYATNARTDFLDVYLGAKCRFFICDGSGVSSIPMVFRRPIVWVNYIELEYIPIWGVEDLFIIRKLWLRKERRFLTFSEIISSDIKGFFDTEQYEQLGIELVGNSPEDITTLVVEMDERLKGKWQTTDEDEELQRRFWSIYKAHWPHRKVLSRIGTEFLRQNRELLK